MDEEMLLAALGCGRLPGILDITAKHSFVVFGTMDEEVFVDLNERIACRTTPSLPVYFYETG